MRSNYINWSRLLIGVGVLLTGGSFFGKLWEVSPTAFLITSITTIVVGVLVLTFMLMKNRVQILFGINFNKNDKKGK